MICVSIGERSLTVAQRQLRRYPFVEVRIDLMRPSLEDLRSLVSRGTTVIATCRPGAWSDGKRLQYLLRAIELGASYVDVELDSPKRYRERINHAARERGCRIIISHHDMRRTPSTAGLRSIGTRAFDAGADIVKIACFVRTLRDNANLLGLLGESFWSGRLVVVGMGALGQITRIAAPMMGAPFTFASAGAGRETASGQLSADALKQIWKKIGWKL